MPTIDLPTTQTLLFTSAIPPAAITCSGGWVDLEIQTADTTSQGTDIAGQSQQTQAGQSAQKPEATIWKTRIHTATGTHTLHLRDILQTWHQATAAATATATLTATDQAGTATKTIKTIYSRATINTDAQTYTQSRFLSQQGIRHIPRQRAFDSISLWTDQEQGEEALLTINYITPDGTHHTHETTHQCHPGHNRIDIDFQAILDQINGSLPDGTQAIPHMATLTAGERSQAWIFTRRQPSAAITYADNFNSPTHIWLYGTWAREGKVTQQKILAGTEYQSAGADPQPEYTIRTHPLTFTQSYIIPEIAMSRVLWVYLFAQGTPLNSQAFKATPSGQTKNANAPAATTFRAIATEGSLDASPGSAEKTIHTIKVTAADTADALGYRFDLPRIFTHQFDRPFT